jgi:glucose-6-phosphate isomerase, archaeal
MKTFDYLQPCSVSIDFHTGKIENASAHYQKRLSDLRGVYQNEEALELRIQNERDPVCYENFAVNSGAVEGDLWFGTTIIYPGKVGREYHMTRGHRHKKIDRAETYQTLSGKGLVLFELPDGTVCTAPLDEGTVTYIPPFWGHRSVNTSASPLIFLWTCATDAGHDYTVIAERGMRRIVVENDGMPQVIVNPRFRL